jgi:hypothetical protein
VGSEFPQHSSASETTDEEAKKAQGCNNGEDDGDSAMAA